MDEEKPITNEVPVSEAVNKQPEIKIKMVKNLSTRALLIGAIVCVIVVSFLSHVVRDWIGSRMPSIERRVETDSAMLEAMVRRVAKLATLEFMYTEAGVQEDQNSVALFGREFNIPGTTRRLIVRWQGTLLLGINAEDIYVQIIEHDEKREVIVTLPDARILSHAIDMGGIDVLDASIGIFTRFNLIDLPNFIYERMDEIDTRVSTVELLKRAKLNAEEAIYDLFRLVLDKDIYAINFVR
jgi:hypothetical protein